MYHTADADEVDVKHALWFFFKNRNRDGASGQSTTGSGSENTNGKPRLASVFDQFASLRQVSFPKLGDSGENAGDSILLFVSAPKLESSELDRLNEARKKFPDVNVVCVYVPSTMKNSRRLRQLEVEGGPTFDSDESYDEYQADDERSVTIPTLYQPGKDKLCTVTYVQQFKERTILNSIMLTRAAIHANNPGNIKQKNPCTGLSQAKCGKEYRNYLGQARSDANPADRDFYRWDNHCEFKQRQGGCRVTNRHSVLYL